MANGKRKATEAIIYASSVPFPPLTPVISGIARVLVTII